MNYYIFQKPFDKLKIILAILICMNATGTFCQCFNTNQSIATDVVVPHFSGSVDTISDESWNSNSKSYSNIGRSRRDQNWRCQSQS